MREITDKRKVPTVLLTLLVAVPITAIASYNLCLHHIEPEIVTQECVTEETNRIIQVGGITETLNKYRDTPLQESDILNAQACRRAEYIVSNGEHNHDGFDDWFDEAWSGWLGENLAYDWSGDEEGMIQVWMDSPTHRENIENPDYHYHGSCEYGNTVVSVFAESLLTN